MTLPAGWIWGLGLVLAAGIMQGGFPLPMKFTRVWEWENIWLSSSLWALAIFPWMIAAWTIPNLRAVLATPPPESILVVFLFGVGWGMGGLLFGLGVHRMGLSLTLGIVIGLTSALGSLLPMVLFHPEKLRERAGMLVFSSVLVTLAGLWLCTMAGLHRERSLQAAGGSATGRRGSYWGGIAICVASGVLSPMFNFALICGELVMRAATAHGAKEIDAPNVIWAVAMTGGLVPTAAYCWYLLRRNRTWTRFAQAGQSFEWMLAVVMGVLFAFGNSAYGMGTEQLGALGAIAGWPIFMAVQVITGNLLGAATGEWRGAGATAVRFLVAGTLALILAVCLVGPS